MGHFERQLTILNRALWYVNRLWAIHNGCLGVAVDFLQQESKMKSPAGSLQRGVPAARPGVGRRSRGRQPTQDDAGPHHGPWQTA